MKTIQDSVETISHDKRVTPELQEYRRQIEAVNADARELIAGLSEAQFNWARAPGHWSIAECLDHLTMTNRELIGEMKRAIGDARTRGLTASGPFRYGIIGNLLVRSQEPPARMKFKAPKSLSRAPINRPKRRREISSPCMMRCCGSLWKRTD